MAIMAMDTVRTSTLALTSLLVLTPAISMAGEWQFTPSIIIDETYTNNVELNQTEGISSLVSQTGIALDSKFKAKHLDFSFNSTSTYAFYSHDHQLDDDYHTLNSKLDYMLWPNGVVFSASANISNQSRNNARNALADIVSSDTSQVRNYNASLIYNIDNFDFSLNSNIGYRATESDDNLGERQGIIANISSRNGSGARHIFWDMSSTYQELENNNRKGELYRSEIKLGWITGIKFNPFIRFYDEDNQGLVTNSGNLDSNAVGAGFRWLVTPRFYLDLSYNQPKDDSTDLNGEPLDNFIDVNIGWQPSQRTELSAGLSQRFYGDSYRFSFNHKNRRLSNNISYNETVQAFTRNSFQVFSVGNFLCPSQEVIDIENCYLVDGQEVDLDNSQLITINDFELIEDQSYSLNKTLNWNTTLTLPRTTFMLTLAGNERLDLNSDQKNRNKSASFTVNRKLGPRSSVALSTRYTETQLQAGDNNSRLDRYRQYNLNYSRNLNKELIATFSLNHVDRSSGQLLFNYQENRVNLKVTKGF